MIYRWSCFGESKRLQRSVRPRATRSPIETPRSAGVDGGFRRDEINVAAMGAQEGASADGGHARDDVGSLHVVSAFRASRPLGRRKF